MNSQDRRLYHQVHPLKLSVDWVAAIVGARLLWQHRFMPALIVGFGSPVLVSVLLLRYAKLEHQRQSQLGRYVADFMTHRVEAMRLAGLAVFWAGAWYRRGRSSSSGVWSWPGAGVGV